MIRTLVVAALVCALALSIGAPIAAGPLTGAPAIKFEAGGAEAVPGAKSWGMGLAYSAFKIKLRDNTTGNKETVNLIGPLVSGEVSFPLGQEKTQSIALGGWFAATTGDNDADASGGEIHARYDFHPNWGVELAMPYFDFKDLFGLAYHLTYQIRPVSMPELRLQFGVGGASDSDDFGGAKFKTDFSLYSNISYKVAENWDATLGLWFLKQKIAWDPSYGWADDDMNTLQWSLGASYSF
jgi:hypothetical protein